MHNGRENTWTDTPLGHFSQKTSKTACESITVGEPKGALIRYCTRKGSKYQQTPALVRLVTILVNTAIAISNDVNIFLDVNSMMWAINKTIALKIHDMGPQPMLFSLQAGRTWNMVNKQMWVLKAIP